jgi:hypothetical protein
VAALGTGSAATASTAAIKGAILMTSATKAKLLAGSIVVLILAAASTVVVQQVLFDPPPAASVAQPTKGPATRSAGVDAQVLVRKANHVLTDEVAAGLGSV